MCKLIDYLFTVLSDSTWSLHLTTNCLLVPIDYKVHTTYWRATYLLLVLCIVYSTHTHKNNARGWLENDPAAANDRKRTCVKPIQHSKSTQNTHKNNTKSTHNIITHHIQQETINKKKRVSFSPPEQPFSPHSPTVERRLGDCSLLGSWAPLFCASFL